MNTLSRPPHPRTPLGAAAVDDRLEGGLAHGVLHEFYGDYDDPVCAFAFAILIALRAAPARPIFVVRDDRRVRAIGRLYGDGIAALGGDPSTFVMVHAPDVRTMLRTVGDVVACPGVGAVVVDPADPAAFDLTASRRVALRAEASGVFTALVRHGEPRPSAATTRWHVRRAVSAPLAADAPGFPAYDLELLRHRGGVAGFTAQVEWNCDEANFRDVLLQAEAAVEAKPDRHAA